MNAAPLASLPRAPVAVSSWFDGTIIVVEWPVADLLAWLPPGLTLAPLGGFVTGVHPVLVVVGAHSDGRMRFGGMTLPMRVEYREAGLFVPFVYGIGRPRLHTFVARMFSSSPRTVWHGNAHYGFHKSLAAVDRVGPLFSVTAADGRALLHGAAHPTSAWSEARSERADRGWLRAAVGLPILGRKRAGTYVVSHFDWCFDAARVRAVDAWIALDAPLVDGMAAREHDDGGPGSFDIHGLRWRLTWPRQVVG